MDTKEMNFMIGIESLQYEIPSRVLDEDLKTPDATIPRDQQMIRLTGLHPFNAEAYSLLI
jgi:hypothetical protein